MSFAIMKIGIMLKKNNNTKKELAIMEVLPLDSKRRLVLIKRGNKKHLLLLGNNDLVVESAEE